MADFDNVEFPLPVSSMSCRIRYSTPIVTLDEGREQRNINWDTPLRVFDAASAIRSLNDLALLRAFFRARKGSARAFLLRDWADFNLGETGDPTTGYHEDLGVIASGTADYQIRKIYTDGAYSDYRTIRKPQQGTLIVHANSTQLFESTHWGCDYATGILTLNPGTRTTYNGQHLYVVGQYYTPVRFSTDELRTDLIMMALTRSAGRMPRVEMIETREWN